jgi:hypothetical protein
MHGNRRYVKLAWIGLVAGLAVVSPARAELVAPIGTHAVLAVGPKYAPVVAYTDNGAVLVARRGPNGVWISSRAAVLPPGTWSLAGMVVDGRGRAAVLAEDLRGGRLTLVRLGRTTLIARTTAGAQLGPAGIVLDAFGLPAVAYAVRRPDNKTYLRLTRLGRDGRFVTKAVTRGGFPSSSRVPAAVPVLVGRTVHVVEAVGSAAIDWGPTKKSWEGQYLFTSQLGTVVGPVAAAARGGTLHAALTLDLPQFGESNVVAIASARGQQSDVVFSHALLAGLAVPTTGREVAANDFVAASNGNVFAGLVAAPTLTAELDGRIDGYRAIAEGSRYILLAHPTMLEFFAVPALLPVAVHLEVTTFGNTVFLDGSVAGATGGEVEIYRETNSSREWMIRAPVHSDGTFAVRETPLPSGVVYRAVYQEPTTGLPYAALARSSCCATRPR